MIAYVWNGLSKEKMFKLRPKLNKSTSMQHGAEVLRAEGEKSFTWLRT